MSSSHSLLDNEEVEFLLAASVAEDPGGGAPDIADTDQPVTMRGDLDQMNLSDVFQTLSMSRMEGVLRVHNPLEHRQIYCNEGFLRILVPERVIHRRLGQRLLAAEQITAEQLRLALLRQRKDRKPLGELLIEDGHLTEEALTEVLDGQMAEDLFALFTWGHGTFAFYKGAVTDPALRERFETCPEFEINGLLLEVARRDDEWQSILAAIHSLDEVPCTLLPDPPDDLDELSFALFRQVDGRRTWRQIAEVLPYSLFDVARAARDLVHRERLGPCSEEQMVDVAHDLAQEGRTKQAVMVLQALREREQAPSIEVVRKTADVLVACDETHLAGIALLEVAQQADDAEAALQIAREASKLAPHDGEVLAFFRTTLLAHSAGDSPELQECTLSLIDALLEEDRVETALEIVADARATGTASLELLWREARLRQKSKDAEGAIEVLEEIAQQLREAGNTQRLAEVYAAILKIDGRRNDIRRLLVKARRTPMARMLRIAAAALSVALLATAGVAYWQEKQHETQSAEAKREIDVLLEAEDRLQARDRLTYWSGVLGPCEAIDEMRRRIDVADAAAMRQRAEEARRRVADRLRVAGEQLGAGRIDAMFAAYAELLEDPEYRGEAGKSLRARLDRALGEIRRIGAGLLADPPPPVDPLLERSSLEATLTALEERCPPELQSTFDGLLALRTENRFPDILDEETKKQIEATLDEFEDVFAMRKERIAGYRTALRNHERQRAYDPVFKEALAREEACDFPGALELFRRLEKLEAAPANVRAMFRDHINRNATICRLQSALEDATSKGDFATAIQHLKALEAAFPEVPFREHVRLPLRIETLPSGSKVEVNGQTVGTTPCILAIVPARKTVLRLSRPGFSPRDLTVPAEHGGRLDLVLRLNPRYTLASPGVIDAPPALLDGGRSLFVDRSGRITCYRTIGDEPAWSVRTGDLSGLLTPPLRTAQAVLVGSLDGDFRALDPSSGEILWSLPDLPTALPLVAADGAVFLATADKRLCRIAPDTRKVRSIALPGGEATAMLAHGGHLYVVTRTSLQAFASDDLRPLWKTDLPVAGKRFLAFADGNLVVADDTDSVASFAVASGRPTWRQQVVDLIPAPPLVDGGTLLLMTHGAAVRLGRADGSVRERSTWRSGEASGPALRVGDRVLVPNTNGDVQVLDRKTTRLLYTLEGSRRDTVVLPWRNGALVAGPDRKVRFYVDLP